MPSAGHAGRLGKFVLIASRHARESTFIKGRMEHHTQGEGKSRDDSKGQYAASDDKSKIEYP